MRATSDTYWILDTSYGTFMTCGRPVMAPGTPKPKVLPSGVARTVASTPMVPLAPALFSITMVWPSRWPSAGASSRARLSTEPPGG